MIVTRTASASAITTESQIPYTSLPVGKTSGSVNTAITWKTSVLKNEIIADIGPLLRAVKKDEPNIANPANKKEKEKIKNARTVSPLIKSL